MSKSAQKQYVLLCDSMTGPSCEEAVVKTLLELSGVIEVKASAALGTIKVVAEPCGSCCGTTCSCCNCSPCTCEVCRCCSCGVDAYLKALEDIDHTATYPAKSGGKPKEEPGNKQKKAEGVISLVAAVGIGAACFVVGYLLQPPPQP